MRAHTCPDTKQVGTKPETHSCPNEFSCSLLSVLCGFIIITLLMQSASMKEINTTSLHSRECQGLVYLLYLLAFCLYIFLLCVLSFCVCFFFFPLHLCPSVSSASLSLIKSLLPSFCLFPRSVSFTLLPPSADLPVFS